MPRLRYLENVAVLPGVVTCDGLVAADHAHRLEAVRVVVVTHSGGAVPAPFSRLEGTIGEVRLVAEALGVQLHDCRAAVYLQHYAVARRAPRTFRAHGGPV